MNSKGYIGSTKDYHYRIQAHFSLLSKNKHFNLHLQRTYDKYGPASFTPTALELISGSPTIYKRVEIENKWLLSVDKSLLFNVRVPTTVGVVHTDDIRLKMSTVLRKAWARDPARRLRQSANAKARWADPGERSKNIEGLVKSVRSERRRKLASQNFSTLWANPEYKRKMSEAFKNSKISMASRVHGETHGCAVVTDEIVLFIRNEYKKAKENGEKVCEFYERMGQKFGIVSGTVKGIAIRQSWRHLP